MKQLFFLLGILIGGNLFAQSYNYSVDLNKTENDKVPVKLACFKQDEDVVKFSFPKTIPGTYATLNYGVYIEDFKALSEAGEELKVKKDGENTWIISGAKKLKTITYSVNDSWDSGIKKNKIFEPAGTNFEHDKNYVFNNSGLFGFFEGKELMPFEIMVEKPNHLYGLTVLSSKSNENSQLFTAKDYHQLVDCPILFAKPDTAKFKISNTDVTIGVYSEYQGEFAHKIYDELKSSMSAIDHFVGDLPVDNYSFLIYLADKSELGASLSKEVTVGSIAKLAKLGGVGALEHGNSSFYYLVYMGENELKGPLGDINYINIIKDVAIHEFMHIFTPLSLHSECIGEFNYVDPKMSKHLWLYEGITEYFAGLIQLQDGLFSLDHYLNEVMRPKLKYADRFPEDKMTFTEMSENVLDKPYKRQYGQVYQRGAVMGMLLDLEIIRLTKGEKTLKDVVITLGKRYGADKSFDEATFISEFVTEVHPDLQLFFDNYVSGNKSLPVQEYMDRVGVKYSAQVQQTKPYLPYKEDGVKIKKSLTARLTGETPIKKVSKKIDSPLKKGDIINVIDWKDLCYDDEKKILPEGTKITAPVKRNGEKTAVTFALKHGESSIKHDFEVLDNLNQDQQKMRSVWSKQ